MDRLRRDLAIFRGPPSWRRTVILLSYVQVALTVCVDVDLVVVDHVGLRDFVMINMMALGIAAAASIAGHGFKPVPVAPVFVSEHDRVLGGMADVAAPSAAEDRITAERAAWARKFNVSA